ncbi:G-type lectin S-receptor-like serine/threonine-protein kinase LECRK3 [Magnolia sinica]|uniref:G-type lectin S-receptor-like serine/threonine-protein kinase LECRK3 n=1 Tax=Magnolia sinica TaxID=86752 RepID=UPI00265B3011|nr:G-type lectin S-receptor-like serine/threonine-protein kinase LECRK3 [Magnolia sinica]
MRIRGVSHLLHLLLLFLPFSAIAQTHSNISLGSSLSNLDENMSWRSPSGEFAFGFHLLPEKNLFLLAIWFDQIPEKTIVWSANGDNLVQKGSRVELTTNGRLVLNDHQGEEIWWTESNNGGIVVSAAMLDTGNFVLMSMDSIVWASFDNPTDNILPTQILGLDKNLTSRLIETDYSRGRFLFNLQSDGNFVFYPIALPTEYRYSPYWASNTYERGSQLVFNSSGRIYIKLRDGGSQDLAPANEVPTMEFYQRATFDFDGVFRQYLRPKTQFSDGRWAMSWSVAWFLPSDMCFIEFGILGSGACGLNSYCKMDENQRPSCHCPPGYSFLDPNNKYKGCEQDFRLQNCSQESQDRSKEEPQYQMIEMLNTDWKQSDYEKYSHVNEDQCREFCLNDCLCMAAAFRDGDCLKKSVPLSNGKMDPRIGVKILVKVSKNISTLPPPSVDTGKKDRSTLILVGSVLLGSSVFLNFMFFLAILLLCFILQGRKLREVKQDSTMLGKNLQSFSYKELKEATGEFKEELGRGAFGTVYKGSLVVDDSTSSVAVKKLEKVVEEGEKEFMTEVIAIGQTHHKNLVQLLGFCDEGPHRLLVYEFMSNGSLSSFLFGGLKPKWNLRMQIALGIARGLMYLHEECSTQIIHCDIKPSNILLDDCLTARISDFGLAKLLKTDQTRTSTGIRGTRGYVAREWFMNMPITSKVDVYSFGIVLLEIICCRKNVESKLGNEEEEILADWVYDCYREERLNLLVESEEDAMVDKQKLERLVKVAIWCIQEEQSLRPSMTKVTQMLEGAVAVSVPPDPSSSIG